LKYQKKETEHKIDINGEILVGGREKKCGKETNESYKLLSVIKKGI
jgi:hypothetical protein